MIHDAQDKGRAAFLVGARPTVLAFLEKQGVIKHLADGHSVQKRLEALRMAAETVSQTSLRAGWQLNHLANLPFSYCHSY